MSTLGEKLRSAGKLLMGKKKTDGNDDERRRLSGPGSSSGAGSSSGGDPMLWSWDLDRHYRGAYSFAVVQGNQEIEDYSQVEIGRRATFAGVYDGHGGPDAARFVMENLFNHLIHRVENTTDNISEDTIRDAFAATERGFLTVVERTHDVLPAIKAMGTCCLVGVVVRRTLYVANLGDSRAVLGYTSGLTNKINAEQITTEHNVSNPQIRTELMNEFYHDPSVVRQVNGVWRVKGIIQVSRTIGDAYLKIPGYEFPPKHRFHFNPPIDRAVLSANPSSHTRTLRPQDRFVIFASDGLWEILSNQEAVETVHSHRTCRAGIARILIEKALKKAAKKLKIKYEDLRNVESEKRRAIHDDISVIVLFIDNIEMDEASIPPLHQVSIRGFDNQTRASRFNQLQS